MSRFCKISKTKRLRQRMFFQYNKAAYTNAARLGEALLRAHANHNSTDTSAYEDDLYNVALASGAAKRVNRAIELYIESIRRAFMRDGVSLVIAARLSNLAALLSVYDQHESACRIFMQAITIRKQLLYCNHPELGDAFYNMGNALIRAGRYHDAVPALKNALHIYIKSGSDNFINCLHAVASAYESLKEYHNAIPFAEAAWHGLADIDQDEHYRAGYYLAGLYEATNRHNDACKLYFSIIEWVEKTVGCFHSGYINLTAKAASQLVKLGKYQQSKDVLSKLSKLIEGKVGHNNLTYANCIKNLAIIHRHLGEWDEAEAVLRNLHESDKLKP